MGLAFRASFHPAAEHAQSAGDLYFDVHSAANLAENCALASCHEPRMAHSRTCRTVARCDRAAFDSEQTDAELVHTMPPA